MEKKKILKIAVSGYYGFGNTGDEAILTSLLRILKRIPNSRITVLSAFPKRTTKEHGVRSILRINPLSVLWAISSCDLLISGGGGLLQDATSSRSLLYYLSIIYLGVILKKRVVLLAQSIGPISKKGNRTLTSWILNRVSLITVRDEHSLKELEKLGVRKVPIFQTSDLALLLEKPDLKEEREAIDFLGVEKPFVVFCLRNLKHKKISTQTFSQIAQAVQRKLQAKVVFLPFQFSVDQELCEELSSLVPGSIACPFLKPNQIIGLFRGAELVVGMRLHSLIFSVLSRTPFIPISYDPKVSSFAELLGQEPLSLDDSPEKIFSKIEEYFQNRAKIKENLEESARRLEEKAEENWKHLENLINTIS
ncbi:MAG: polysaccharide pyruvyl transferase CsaB [Caldiserica bacterium]|nr:polysaccharide pyruvyl transferase CsaB [Caldisericota bacterium]MDH7563097.1 polysaccharide pyruvyl transferase CsaB [Caldisericota bacterium]